MGDSSVSGFKRTPLRRRVWSQLATIFTFYLPSPLLRLFGFKTKESIQVWKEKVTICTILLIISSIFIFLAEGLPRIACLSQASFTLEKLKASKFVLIHGEVIDLTRSTSVVGDFSKKYPGQDISSAFPLYDLLARFNKNKTYPHAPINACIENVTRADAWLRKTLTSSGYVIKDRTMRACPNPDQNGSVKSVPCFFKKEEYDEVKRNKVADYAYTQEEIKSKPVGDLLQVSSSVFDLKKFLGPQVNDKNNLDERFMMFPKDITQRIKDVNSLKASQELAKTPNWPDYQKCLKLMFYRGKVVEPTVLGLEPACLPWLTTLVVMIIPLALLFLKLFLSFIPPQRPSAAYNGYSSCILLVPCFNETREELEGCISSVIETNYIDHGKLLVVVCDGQFCADVVLDILCHQGPGSEPKSYQSVGKGNKAINSAQVYSGYHYHGAHGVPYLVVVKTGNVHEAEFSGNRGKRDSMLVVLNFLDGISSPENLLTPLEAEMLENIQGLDLVPSTFNYLFCVDADTRVDPDSLPQMLHHLDSRPDCLAVSGQLRFNSGGHWLLDPLQRFRACFSRHQDMCAMSALGTLSSLNGGFTAYRLQQSTGTRCLTHEDIVFQLSSKRTNTLHTKHLLLLGEEQYITTLLLKCWPGLRLGYVPGALAKTSGYASIRQLVLKERSAFCTYFHNLLDLWTSSAIWGLSWATFIWISFCLLWTFLMPVFTGFLYFQLVRVILVRALPYLLLPFLAGACFFLVLVFSILNYHPGLLIGLILYLVFGLPLYHILIPLYSFLSMDNFNWYDIGGDQIRARPHGAMEEVLGRPIMSMHNRSTRPYERAPNHLSYRSAYLPAPGGFQSLYTELNQMGLPINMPSSEASPGQLLRGETVPMAVFPHYSSFMSDSSSGNGPEAAPPLPPPQALLSQQPMRISLASHSPLTTRHIPGLRDSIALNTGKSFSRAHAHKSDSIGLPFNFEPVPNLGLGLAKDFPLPPSMSPEMSQRESGVASFPGRLSMQVSDVSNLGMGSFAFPKSPRIQSRSEYNSDFSLSVTSLAHYDTYLEDAASLASSLPSDRLSRSVTGSNALPANSVSRGPENSEAVLRSKAMIREEIDYFLRDADLHSVTRREVKEHLLAVFGDNVSFYQDYVSQCIEEFTLERLAAQDSSLPHHPPPSDIRSSQII